MGDDDLDLLHVGHYRGIGPALPTWSDENAVDVGEFVTETFDCRELAAARVPSLARFEPFFLRTRPDGRTHLRPLVRDVDHDRVGSYGGPFWRVSSPLMVVAFWAMINSANR